MSTRDPSASGPPPYDAARALSNVGDDPETLAAVVAMFREQAPARMRAAEEAVAGGDAAALETAAHALKGSAATLGMEPLAELAGRLEALGESGLTAEASALLPGLREEMARALEACVRGGADGGAP